MLQYARGVSLGTRSAGETKPENESQSPLRRAGSWLAAQSGYTMHLIQFEQVRTPDFDGDSLAEAFPILTLRSE